MANEHIQTDFPFQVILHFLRLTQTPLRQLLNRCRLSIGLMRTGDSALIINCDSLSDARNLVQDEIPSLASAAELLGIRWIVIRHHEKSFYGFNAQLVLPGSEQGETGINAHFDT